MSNIENVIEFLKDSRIATVTFTQGRHKSNIRKLSEMYPEDVEIIEENADGSLCAHVPVNWIKISKPRAVSEKQKELARQRLEAYRETLRDTE